MTPLQRLREDILFQTRLYNRNPEGIRTVIASKYFSAEEMLALYREGVRDFGENRVGEVLAKKSLLPEDVRWHFIGHLQRNKVRKVLGLFALIHSIDSVELAEKISKTTREKQKILLQVNTTGETTKGGFSPKELPEAFRKIKALSFLEVRGLMTIGPDTDDRNRSQKAFRLLRELRDFLDPSLPELSMGMSGDYPSAIEEGATLLRIGRILLSGTGSRSVR